MSHILAIDDDAVFLKSIKKNLSLHNFTVTTLENPQKVLSVLEDNYYHCILLDVKMPGMSGLTVLRSVLGKFPHIPVIMVSGQSDIQIAVDAVKMGAFDFIEKPLDPDRLIATINHALKKLQLEEEKELFYNELHEQYRMIGESNEHKEVISLINKIADTQAKVLITGESGTGKELVAWAIHHNSKRKSKPYLKLNCAAIPSELLESELFGHKKGAFTGAVSDRKGKFPAADGGTLFLDEIGDMSFQLQAKLLRVLQDGEIDLIGENSAKNVDVRIVSATNKDLDQMIKEEKFRKDLYHRLNIVNIYIPPLRKRSDDILPLANYFLEKFKNEYNKNIQRFCTRANSLLLNYNWPGNVRELKNVVEKIVIFCENEEVSYETVQTVFNNPGKQTSIIPENGSLHSAKLEFEKIYILKILDKHDWKINQTAEYLGIDRTNLFKKMKKAGIHGA